MAFGRVSSGRCTCVRAKSDEGWFKESKEGDVEIIRHGGGVCGSRGRRVVARLAREESTYH